jgi:Domain of unknown function (DUF4124)
MRIILFTLMSLVCTVSIAATVYKWVDEDGVTHYSDQPHENAQKVELAAPQTYPAPRGATRPAPSGSAAAPPPPPAPYQSCAVVEPQNDQNLPNASSVSTSVQVEPRPRAGDQVYLFLDGQRVPGFPPLGGPYTISPVDRGTHSLRAVVQDSNGNVVCQSANVTFSVTQPSVLSPVSPVHPR